MTRRDLTDRSSKMPRGEALLYKVKDPKPDGPHWQGLCVFQDGSRHWRALWADCEVNGQQVLHVKVDKS